MPDEIDAGRLIDEELERELVAAVKAAVRPSPQERAATVIAQALGRLALANRLGTFAGFSSAEDTEKRLAVLYSTWAKEIAKVLNAAGLLTS